MAKKIKRGSDTEFPGRQFINRYSIATLLFLVWIVFFDKYKVSTSLYLTKTVEKLEVSKEEYKVKIAQAIIDKNQLEGNSEKFAREKFFMHKENEEVFIIEKERK